MRILDRQTVRESTIKLIEAAQAALGEGWKVQQGGATRFDPTTGEMTIKVKCLMQTAEAGAAKAQTEDALWQKLAPVYGLPADGYGRTFHHAGEAFKVASINPNRPKYPVSATRLRDGRSFKFPAITVKTAL